MGHVDFPLPGQAATVYQARAGRCCWYPLVLETKAPLGVPCVEVELWARVVPAIATTASSTRGGSTAMVSPEEQGVYDMGREVPVSPGFLHTLATNGEQWPTNGTNCALVIQRH